VPGAIYKYDFHLDHGIGNDDHSDGTAYEYLSGQVKYVKGVPSHLAYDAATKMLYIADSGNSRILRLDTTTGTLGQNLLPYEPEPMAAYAMMDGAVAIEVVSASSRAVRVPSGLLLRNGFLYVSDAETSVMHAFTLEGVEVNHLDTGLPAGSLAGMAFGPDGRVYFVDMLGSRVLRIDPPGGGGGNCAQASCGGVCCLEGQSCFGGACCTTAQQCGSACCGANETCLAGSCCSTPRVCGSICCAGSEACVGGACCDVTLACGGTCCPTGSLCFNNNGSLECVATCGTSADCGAASPCCTPTQADSIELVCLPDQAGRTCI
jgi:hypothetical protein